MVKEPTMRPVEETYEDVKDTISTTVNCFRRKYGGDLDELTAQAQFYFVKAARDYQPRKGRFIPYLRFRIWVELCEAYSEEVRRYTSRRKEVKLTNAPQPEPAGLEQLLCDLGNDARFLISMIIWPHPAAVCNAQHYGRADRPDNLFNGVCDTLEAIGWGEGRLQVAINEVEEALR